MSYARRALALSIAICVGVPAAFAVGSPNVNSQYGSPGIFGYDFRDISFPNPGFPDSYGVRRDAYGALRDADMLPDNSVIGAVPGQYQDLGIRKQLPYPYNMGGYETGWWGQPYPGAFGLPAAGNGFTNNGSGYSNAFNSFGRAFETAATLMPNGWFGNGFSGNGVETGTLANESGASAFTAATDGNVLQPANNMGLVARGFAIQPGATYGVFNPLAGGAVNAGSIGKAVAGAPTANFGLANPLAGQPIGPASAQISTIPTTNFAPFATPAPTNSQFNMSGNVNNVAAVIPGTANTALLGPNASFGVDSLSTSGLGNAIARGVAVTGPQANFGASNFANLPAGNAIALSRVVNGPQMNFNGGSVPIGIIGQSNFSQNGSTANIPNLNPALNGTTPNTASTPFFSQVGTTNFATSNSIGAGTGPGSPYPTSLPPGMGTPTGLSSLPVENFASTQDVTNNTNTAISRIGGVQRFNSTPINNIGTTDFATVPSTNSNRGSNFATIPASDFSPFASTGRALTPSGIGAPAQVGTAGTTQSIQTFGRQPSTSTPIATIGATQFSAVSPQRVQVPNGNVPLNTLAQINGPSPSNFAGGFGGALVQSNYRGFKPSLMPPNLRRGPIQDTYVPPMRPVTNRRPLTEYGLVQNPTSNRSLAMTVRVPSGTANSSASTLTGPARIQTARIHNINSKNTTISPGITTSVVGRSYSGAGFPAAQPSLVSAIGPITGSMQYDDGRVTIFGARGSARELADHKIAVSLNDGTEVNLSATVSEIRQIAENARARM